MFKIHILSYHDDIETAVIKEIKLQKQYQVHNNPMFINKSIQNRPFYCGKHSNETRIKQSEVAKGRTFSEETRLKMSISGKRRIHSDETKLKMSISTKANIDRKK